MKPCWKAAVASAVLATAACPFSGCGGSSHTPTSEMPKSTAAEGPGGAEPTGNQPPTGPPVASVQPQQAHSFSLFKAPPRVIPRTGRETIASTLPPHAFGLNLRLARYIRAQAGMRAWVVPGDGFICMFPVGRRAAGCNTTEQVAAHGMRIVLPSSLRAPAASHEKRYVSLGIAPDGVARVKVIEGRRVGTVSVRDNVYSFRSEKPADVKLLQLP